MDVYNYLTQAPKMLALESPVHQAKFIVKWGEYIYMQGYQHKKVIRNIIEELLKNAEKDCDDTGIDFLRDLVNELDIQTGRTR